jgi:hypothetical protein
MHSDAFTSPGEQNWVDVHHPGGYLPIIQQRAEEFRWFVPVDSGHMSFTCVFALLPGDVSAMIARPRRSVLLYAAIHDRCQRHELTDADFRECVSAIMHAKAPDAAAVLEALDTAARGAIRHAARLCGIDMSNGWQPER